MLRRGVDVNEQIGWFRWNYSKDEWEHISTQIAQREHRTLKFMHSKNVGFRVLDVYVDLLGRHIGLVTLNLHDF